MQHSGSFNSGLHHEGQVPCSARRLQHDFGGWSWHLHPSYCLLRRFLFGLLADLEYELELSRVSVPP